MDNNRSTQTILHVCYYLCRWSLHYLLKRIDDIEAWDGSLRQHMWSFTCSCLAMTHILWSSFIGHSSCRRLVTHPLIYINSWVQAFRTNTIHTHRKHLKFRNLSVFYIEVFSCSKQFLLFQHIQNGFSFTWY
jgi:hypothetical protein